MIRRVTVTLIVLALCLNVGWSIKLFQASRKTSEIENLNPQHSQGKIPKPKEPIQKKLVTFVIGGYFSDFITISVEDTEILDGRVKSSHDGVHLTFTHSIEVPSNLDVQIGINNERYVISEADNWIYITKFNSENRIDIAGYPNQMKILEEMIR